VTAIGLVDGVHSVGLARSDAVLEVWNLSNGSLDRVQNLGGTYQIRSFALNGTASRLATVTDDGRVIVFPPLQYFYEYACQRVGSNWSAIEWEEFFGFSDVPRETCSHLPVAPA
jgi:hypothetical protein